MSPKVSFRITTYYKRPRGEAGLTQLASKRLDLGAALDWILSELPDEGWDVSMDEQNKVTLTIDWAKVPTETRMGTRI